MKKSLLILPVLLLGCNLVGNLGSNDEGFGGDEFNDEIGEDPLNGSEPCYGLPQFDLDPLMEEYEKSLVQQSGGTENGEIACYTPDIDFLGAVLGYPNPEQVPDMSEYIEEDVQTGVVCNFLLELPGTVLATEAGEKLPWYTGFFINEWGDFTFRYTACGEPCGAIGIASNIDGVNGLNEFCKDHILRHGINPDGNGFNDGVPLYNEDWSLDHTLNNSSCQASVNAISGDIPPAFVNAQYLPAALNAALDTIGWGIIPDINVNEVPWTWNFWIHTGVCEFESFGYKIVEEYDPETGWTPWYWESPCPNNYFTISQGAILQPYDFPWDAYSFLWIWGRKGYCYMDGLTVSGYVPPPTVPSYLAELGENGTLGIDGWNSLIRVQHGGKKSWPKENLLVPELDEHTATFHLHPALIDLLAINPSLLFEGVVVRKITREDGGGNPKPALTLVSIPEGSLMDALGYKVGDTIFSVRGKDGEGDTWTNQFSNLHGTFEEEMVEMLGLSFNDKVITIMHERKIGKEIPIDHEIRNTFPGISEIVTLGEIQERHFFRWEWSENPETP